MILGQDPDTALALFGATRLGFVRLIFDLLGGSWLLLKPTGAALEFHSSFGIARRTGRIVVIVPVNIGIIIGLTTV